MPTASCLNEILSEEPTLVCVVVHTRLLVKHVCRELRRDDRRHGGV
jgi:hypothetical protein